MTVRYDIPTINDRLAQVVTHIDAGVGNGVLRLMTTTPSQTVVLVTLAKPSGTATGGVLTFSGLPLSGGILVTTVASNPLASADIEDSAGTVIVSGLTIGLSTSYDILMPSTLVSAGQTITLTSATITGV